MIRILLILVMASMAAMAQRVAAQSEGMSGPDATFRLSNHPIPVNAPPPPSSFRAADGSLLFSPLPREENDYLLTPPTVQSYVRPKQWNMRLEEALYLALKNNPEITVQQHVPLLAGTGILEAESQFDSQFEANHHFSVVEQHLTTDITTFGTGSNTQKLGTYGQSAGSPDQFAISKVFKTGTSVRAGFSTGYNDLSPAGSFNTLNPNWRSSLGLQLTQPLARGFGRKIQTLPIRIAKTYQETTEQDFQSIVLKLLRDVEFAYWKLALAHQNVLVRRKNVEEARKTYEKELQKMAIGESSRPEVAEAKLNYLNMVDLYNTRKMELLDQERAFRELLGIPGFDTTRIHVALPDGLPEINTDWESSVQVMLAQRPDLVSQRLTTQSAEMQYRLARNQMLPEVNFESRFAKSGLESRFDRSIDRLINDKDYSWMMGFSYTRDANRYAAKAEMNKARLQWSQQQAVTRQLEFSAVHSLQQAYQQLYQKRYQAEQTQLLRDAARERLQAYREKFELGDVAIELYLRAQAADADAELKLRAAKVDYIQAVVHFEYVRGTLLQARSIQVGGGPAEISPSTESEGNLLEMPKPTISESQNQPVAPEFKDLLKDAHPRVKELLLDDKEAPLDIESRLKEIQKPRDDRPSQPRITQ